MNDQAPTRRSRAEAAAATIVVASVVGGLVVGEIVNLIAGGLAGGLTVFVAEIATLSFVTLRAYPPGAKRPMVRLLIATLLFSPILPLIYITWLWMRGTKWPPANTDTGAVVL